MVVFDDRDDRLAREIIRDNIGEKDPELALVEDWLAELELRLEQVKVYYPFMEINRKRKTEDELAKLAPELCFLVLSYFIYEGKLKFKGISFPDLLKFMAKALSHILGRSPAPEDIKRITAEILDGLQNGGRNYTFATYSFKNAGFREKFVKFLEIKQSADGVLEYFITGQGVDFYLRTKEFPEETKITINLLLFQKQMEKGAYGFAYETVRRLNMEVRKKKDRKYALLEAVMYGRSDAGEAYHRYHRSIVLQFEEEAELFFSAVNNVKAAFNEYVERISSGAATDKEIRTFTLIKIIEKEIGRAQTLHTELLKEAVGFTKEYDQALSVKRKAIFTERFNFQGEFDKLMQENNRPEALKFLFEPLLTPYVRKSFNPLRVLEPQRVARSQAEEPGRDTDAPPAERETVDQFTARRVSGNFLFYAARLLEVLLDTPAHRITLPAFCRDLTARYSQEMIYNGDFLSFLLELNRDKPNGEHVKSIDFGGGKPRPDEALHTMGDVFLQAALATRQEGKITRVVVESFPEEDIELLPGLKITNMVFRGERVR